MRLEGGPLPGVPPRDRVPGVSRLLGLDVGDRRVGVAIADESAGTVRGLAILRRGTVDEDAGRLSRIASEQRADALVVGLPLDMDGGEGEQARRTREWGDAMAGRVGLPLHWRDERLTTEAAEAVQRRLRREPTTGHPTRASIVARRSRVDRAAAVSILRAELEARRTDGSQTPNRPGAMNDLAAANRPGAMNDPAAANRPGSAEVRG